MKRRCLLFTLLAAALAACGAESAQGPTQQVSEASLSVDPNLSRETRILQAIEGYRLIYNFDGPAPHDVARGESFACGGNWRRDGGRAGNTGTYRIEGETICATSAYRNICRRFLRRERDAIVFHDPERGEILYNVRRETYCEADPAGGPSREVRVLPVRELQSLNDGALRELLRGSAINDAPPDHHYEQFDCDRGWVAIGSRAPIPGGYRIADGEACVLGPAGYCARFYRRGDAYYRGYVESHGKVVVAHRIEVTRGVCEP